MHLTRHRRTNAQWSADICGGFPCQHWRDFTGVLSPHSSARFFFLPNLCNLCNLRTSKSSKIRTQHSEFQNPKSAMQLTSGPDTPML